MNQVILDSCLEEVVKVMMIFLSEQGGYSNGYYTFVSGVVNANEKEPKLLSWLTPKAKEELSPKGFENKGKELYLQIQEVLKHHEVDSVTIRYKDENYGAMDVEVIYVQETKKKLPLYRLP